MQESYRLRIGRHIQAVRIERDLTEKQLAEGLCSVTMIRDIEAGRTFATLDLLQSISERLNIGLQQLLSAAKNPDSLQPNSRPVSEHLVTTYRQILAMIEKMEATGDISPDQWISLMLSKADALTHTGQVEAALRLLGEIERRVDADPDAAPNLQAVVYQKLGHAYYQAPNMLESYTQYMKAYLISSHLNEYSPLTSRLTMDLARVGEALGGTKQLAERLFELGVKSREVNDMARAYTYLEQAHALYKAHNMVTTGEEMKQAYTALLRTQSHPEQAIQELMFTAKRLEKAGDTAQLANTYAQKADLHLNVGQTEAAEQDLLLAEQLLTEETAASDPRLTLVYHVRARYFLRVGDYEQAVRYGEQSARLYAAMKFHKQAAESLRYVAEAYREQGLKREAQEIEARREQLQTVRI